MDIRNNVDSLKTLLGVSSASASQSQSVRREAAPHVDSLDGDRATLSNAGSEVSQAASETDVRTGKVAAIQAALAAGTYRIPSSAVASKVVDSMLISGQPSEN